MVYLVYMPIMKDGGSVDDTNKDMIDLYGFMLLIHIPPGNAQSSIGNIYIIRGDTIYSTACIYLKIYTIKVGKYYV